MAAHRRGRRLAAPAAAASSIPKPTVATSSAAGAPKAALTSPPAVAASSAKVAASASSQAHLQHLGSAPIASLKSPPLNQHGGGALKDISNKAHAGSGGSAKSGSGGEVSKPAAGKPLGAAGPKNPADNYEISDREDSSDDDYDSDGGHKVAKKVPDWAKGPALREALEAQFNRKQKLDPDSIFPEVNTCDLDEIFKSFQGQAKKRSYRQRQSTGNWKRDALTSAEKLRYKAEMGY